MNGVRRARAGGASVTAQVAGRPVGIILGLTTSLNPFAARPAFAALTSLSVKDRLDRLRDPAVRAEILAQSASEDLLAVLPPLQRPIAVRWDRQYVLGDPPDYEPDQSRSIEAMAAKTNLPPDAFCYDYLTGANGERMLFYPVTNYVHGDHGVVHDMIQDPDTILGLGDGGAHCGLICDASLPSYMLTHWVRDRHRGPRFPLEFVVKRLTSETADFFGFHDRGRLAVGKKADVNVVDLGSLRLHHPELRYDLPAGGKRLVQRVDGYAATIVAGVPIFEHGEDTGARPGKLVRSHR
jgi:N-acyl-D-amino-acid deacylase